MYNSEPYYSLMSALKELSIQQNQQKSIQAIGNPSIRLGATRILFTSKSSKNAGNRQGYRYPGIA
jgi:hypothetical protein